MPDRADAVRYVAGCLDNVERYPHLCELTPGEDPAVGLSLRTMALFAAVVIAQRRGTHDAAPREVRDTLAHLAGFLLERFDALPEAEASQTAARTLFLLDAWTRDDGAQGLNERR